METIFVYGTLRRGFGNHRAMANARPLGVGRTTARYDLRVDDLPFVMPGATSRVRGELYEIDEAHLARLDAFEGHPKWYRREQVGVEMENGATMLAWMYLYLGEAKGKIVESGDFADAGMAARWMS